MATKTAFSITSIVDDISFSKTDVWVWVKIPPTQYEFIDEESKISIVRDMNLALANLVTSEEKNVEGHLIVTTKPFDSFSWVHRLNQINQLAGPSPENTNYLKDMYHYVHEADFREKIVLLAINIGERRQFSSAKNVGMFSPLLKLSNLIAAPPLDDYISDKEIEYWKNIAHNMSYSLQNSNLNAIPAKAAEIGYTIRKSVHPAMPTPTVDDLSVGDETRWGEGEIAALFDAQIENYPKYLKITQTIDDKTYEGYRATLCINKFPEVTNFPAQEPWIHYASLLSFPVDFSLRFTLEPSRKVRKEVGKKLKEAADQAKNMTNAGGNTSIEVSEQLNLGAELDYALKKDNTPWVYGRYRLTVEGRTLDELKENISQVIDHYRSLDIQVVWPTGDQLSLLKESHPSDYTRIPSYNQHQELSILGAGVPSGSGSAGDSIKYTAEGERGWIGPYIGQTTGRTNSPVFFSIHSTINTDNPGACSITGYPGSGKTFLGLTLTHQMALSGTWTIYIDPKADALSLKNIPGLENATIIDLINGADGLLDPFTIGVDTSQQKDLAYEVISLLIGGQQNLSHEQNVALSNAISTIASYPDASMNRIVDHLMTSPEPGSKSLGSRLNLIRELPFAKLCFSKGNTNQNILRAENGLTIITVYGLDLPGAELSRTDYTNSNHLAVSIMYLLASFTQQLMRNSDRGHPKAIIIDEAWAITSTTQGAKLVDEVARMGRAHNTALLLISQNSGDFLDERIKNSVATKFAFRASGDEIDNVLRYMEMETSDGNRNSIRSLRTGECLMRDWTGRIARVAIDSWDSGRAEAFETNPMERK